MKIIDAIMSDLVTHKSRKKSSIKKGPLKLPQIYSRKEGLRLILRSPFGREKWAGKFKF